MENSYTPFVQYINPNVPVVVWTPVYTLEQQIPPQFAIVPLGNDYNRAYKSVAWSPLEDQALGKHVEEHGAYFWVRVAGQINFQYHGNAKVRTGKHCRERYLNHLNPNLNHGKWTPNEDLELIEHCATMGGRWSKISRIMQGRTENQVKNRWRSLSVQFKQNHDAKGGNSDIVARAQNILDRFTEQVSKDEQLPTDDNKQAIIKQFCLGN